MKMQMLQLQVQIAEKEEERLYPLIKWRKREPTPPQKRSQIR